MIDTNALQLPLLTSHTIAVLSTEAEAIRFPSVAQQMSYTSSKWPLEPGEGKEGREERKMTENLKASSGTTH